MVAAVKGYKLILVMPDSMSVERRRLMLAYGALRADAAREGMKGQHRPPEELVAQTPGLDAAAVREPANIDVHVRTTAAEIAADFRAASTRDHQGRHRRAHHQLRARAEGKSGPG